MARKEAPLPIQDDGGLFRSWSREADIEIRLRCEIGARNIDAVRSPGNTDRPIKAETLNNGRWYRHDGNVEFGSMALRTRFKRAGSHASGYQDPPIYQQGCRVTETAYGHVS